MSDSARHALRQLLLFSYDDLKAQLARRLGSDDRAGDALQETWLRLEAASQIEVVQNPRPYLLRIAYNIALKRRLSEQRTVTVDDARTALNLVDETPDPEQIAEARSELKALDRALNGISERQRKILLASRVNGMSLDEIGRRHGISQRMVMFELKSALLHCSDILGRSVVQRFGPRPVEASKKNKA
jgi:RNA polymerase sigma-70 factor (ECF subfamily)